MCTSPQEFARLGRPVHGNYDEFAISESDQNLAFGGNNTHAVDGHVQRHGGTNIQPEVTEIQTIVEFEKESLEFRASWYQICLLSTVN